MRQHRLSAAPTQHKQRDQHREDTTMRKETHIFDALTKITGHANFNTTITTRFKAVLSLATRRVTFYRNDRRVGELKYDPRKEGFAGYLMLSKEEGWAYEHNNLVLEALERDIRAQLWAMLSGLYNMPIAHITERLAKSVTSGPTAKYARKKQELRLVEAEPLDAAE